MPAPVIVHATAVAIGGCAMLLRGPSGSGKSDLALRLIDAGARLVADDRSEVWRDGKVLLVRSPAAIAGLIEVRGVGILRLVPLRATRLSLLVDLVAPETVERLPDRKSEAILGVSLPLVSLAPFEASTPAKLRLLLGVIAERGTAERFSC
jgi:HPr kinase/phosphorylase